MRDTSFGHQKMILITYKTTGSLSGLTVVCYQKNKVKSRALLGEGGYEAQKSRVDGWGSSTKN